MLHQIVVTIAFVAVVISFICVVVIAFQKPGKGQKLTFLSGTLVLLICIGYFGTTLADDIDLMKYATKIEYMGACFVYPVLLLLYLMLLDIKINRKVMAVLFAVSTIICISALTFDMGPWFYTDYRVAVTGGVPKFMKTYGPMHQVFTLEVMGYTIAFLILLIKKIGRKGIGTGYAFCFSLIAIAPSAAWLLEKVVKSPVSLQPFGFIASDICFMYLISHRLFDINSLAMDMVFDKVDSAIVIFDDDDRFLMANNLAKEMFAGLDKLMKGDSIKEKAPELMVIFNDLRAMYERELKNGLNVRQYDTLKDMAIYKFQDRQYKPSFSLLMNNNSRIGEICMMTDVTAEYKFTISQRDYQAELVRDVNEKTKALKRLQEQMVFGFASIVESKNLVTGGHIKRTSSYVEAIGRELFRERKFPDELNGTFVERLRLVAPLHDVGKISVPDEILDKPAKLSPEEFEKIKLHTTAGAKIVDMTMSMNDSREEYQMAHDIAMYHHEKWDGGGYPEGRKGREIPLCARIMAVADVFDALISRRPYKEPYSMDEAFDILLAESGSHFDPEVVDAFIVIRPEIERLYSNLKDRSD